MNNLTLFPKYRLFVRVGNSNDSVRCNNRMLIDIRVLMKYIYLAVSIFIIAARVVSNFNFNFNFIFDKSTDINT